MRAHPAAVLVTAAVALLSGCASRSGGAASPPASTSGTTAAATTTPGAAGCGYEATPADPAPAGKDVGLPTGTEPTTGSVALHTTQGDITIALTGSTAPCTVRSFAHLVGKKYYDGSPCHRMTTSDGLKVLQCGDPTGTGRGGPGYTLPDENPKDLKQGPPLADGTPSAIYPRGIVAMANTGAPHSGGSQFFVVFGDSTLTPTYAVFGTVDAAALAVLDKIAAAGLDPVNGPQDGSPKSPVTIQQAVVGS